MSDNKYSLAELIVRGYSLKLVDLAVNKVLSGYNEGPIGLLAWDEIVSLIENYTRYFKDKGIQEDKRTTFPLLREILYYKREEVVKDSVSAKLLQGMFERSLDQVRHFTDYLEIYKKLEKMSVSGICQTESSVNLFYEETQTVSNCLHQNKFNDEQIV